MRKLLLVPLVAAGLFLAAPAHADTLDDAFTAAAEEALGVDLVDANSPKLGEATCEAIQFGFGRNALAGMMQQGGSPKVSRAQAVQLVDLVHEYYCPNLDLET
ncbi:hypothetical protein SEA_BEXAN_68 [Mycobacterium phage Bexan]|uniref:DUF732 domain-containing protein n=3 Tax=Fromanvirus TaxID=186764 RepID=G3MEQ3_9CAUD|nr:hypothetical protein VIOLET_68 [Mycobacterium phage Violet]YP_009018294.1 hypothetical protein CM11_gp67 [Mycobacterium phage BillKnuckles]YP_009286754.1 hypothetical protein BI055_gp76 [Mycobacterium phage Makemake]AVJ49878.1 hypothetical protein SEA_ICHABOD_76 [Mycobacterium phage Ichabod]AVO25496.1 hypothetical protein SEA_KYKAR_73 [Mycobacterium phage Kykar]AVP42560.1 hypothetical protein SEA_LOPTON_72 [Mycobacterium phage Lopton]AXH49536.1 hypothetical protein SEA_DRFEELGOOD_69 [Mycob